METQNMKLLDLKTGKYLELSKDFYYGGDGIMIHCYTEEELTDYEELLDFKPNQYIDYDYNDDTKYKKTIKNGFDKAMDDGEAIHLCIEYKSEPQLELKEICEKVGAVVYGGRYILARNTMCEYNIMYKITYADYINAQISRNFEYDQHIYSNVIKNEPQYFIDKFICKEKDYLETIKRLHKIKDDTRIEILQVRYYGQVDIFTEYLKQFRNEPNKLNELKELLK